jgi:hypothetical protein
MRETVVILKPANLKAGEGKSRSNARMEEWC